MTDVEFGRYKLKEEINIRGLHVIMAVDAEFMITIVIHCIYDDKRDELNSLIKKTKTEFKGLHEFSFEEKIEVCWTGLNKYYQSFFNEHKEILNKIDLLREDRNDFAHKKIDFPDKNNPDEILLSEVVNKHKIRAVKDSLSGIRERLYNHYLETQRILKILELFPQVIIPKHPHQ